MHKIFVNLHRFRSVGFASILQEEPCWGNDYVGFNKPSPHILEHRLANTEYHV